MTAYQPLQQVEVFDPEKLRYVSGVVVSATSGCVLVSLNDRMCPVAVDPADHFRIQPLPSVTT